MAACRDAVSSVPQMIVAPGVKTVLADTVARFCRETLTEVELLMAVMSELCELPNDAASVSPAPGKLINFPMSPTTKFPVALVITKAFLLPAASVIVRGPGI